MKLVQVAQQVADAYPQATWWTITGSLVLSIVQPLAAVAALVLACLQIYSWIEKRWKNRNKGE